MSCVKKNEVEYRIQKFLKYSPYLKDGTEWLSVKKWNTNGMSIFFIKKFKKIIFLDVLIDYTFLLINLKIKEGKLIAIFAQPNCRFVKCNFFGFKHIVHDTSHVYIFQFIFNFRVTRWKMTLLKIDC